LTVKANQKTHHRQIRSQFQGKRRIPFVATDHDISHGRDITWILRAKQAPEHIREAWIGTSWIVEVCATGTRDGKTLRGSIEPTAAGGSAFIAQVTLYSAALGLAISQACYATGENHERAVLRQLLGELDLGGVLIQADALHTQKPFFDSSRSRGPTSS
jgi:hypothetical protein